LCPLLFVRPTALSYIKESSPNIQIVKNPREGRSTATSVVIQDIILSSKWNRAQRQKGADFCRCPTRSRLQQATSRHYPYRKVRSSWKAKRKQPNLIDSTKIARMVLEIATSN
jgi:hypothetical protein